MIPRGRVVKLPLFLAFVVSCVCLNLASTGTGAEHPVSISKASPASDLVLLGEFYLALGSNVRLSRGQEYSR